MSIALIVPAAGSGRRLGSERPKALVDLDGVAIVRRTLAKFAGIPDLTETVVVVPETAVQEFNSALEGLEFHVGDVHIVSGGDTRQASVRLGLEAVGSNPDLICVHDAARPLVSRRTLADVIAAARVSGAACAGSRAVDSVREDLGDGRTRALDRTRLWMVETPQVFRFELLMKAHHTAKAMRFTATDDASLVEQAGHPVEIVESTGSNLKITKQEDLELAKVLIARSESRR